MGWIFRRKIGYLGGQCKTQTADCRLQTGGKMQTEGKININNKKTSHKDKIKIVWKTILFYICQLTLSWLQVAAPFGDAIVRVEITSSVLCFCASRCIAMFQIICHTGTSREIDRKTNNYYFEYLNNLGCFFSVQRNAQRISCIPSN